MTIKEIADALRPLTTQLVSMDEQTASRPAVVSKVMICWIMSMADEMTEAEAERFAHHIAVHLAPLLAFDPYELQKRLDYGGGAH